jgi:hypothetical protein
MIFLVGFFDAASEVLISQVREPQRLQGPELSPEELNIWIHGSTYTTASSSMESGGIVTLQNPQ